MVDLSDPGDALPIGIGAVLLLLLLFEPTTVGYLLLGGIVVFVALEILEIREGQTDPVEELLEEPRTEPEEALVGGRISKIVTPQDYANVGMTESLAARLDGEAILLLEEDGESSLVDDVLEAVGYESPDLKSVLVDRETASILHEGAVVAIESQEVMVPLKGVFEARSEVDLDPEIAEETETETLSAVHEITFPESSQSSSEDTDDNADFWQQIDSDGENENLLPVVKE